MKKSIYLLSVLLFVFAFFMVVLYGASGHSVNLEDSDSMLYLSIGGLYLLTAITLLLFNVKQLAFLKKGVIILIVLVLFSILYFFYEISKVKTADFAALIPISILLIVVGFSIKILYWLICKPD